jgi:PAS domain S-box-containing protein
VTPSNAPLSADTDDDTSRQTTLQTIALVIALAATALTPLVWLGTANPPEVLAPAPIGITGWVSLFMLRKGYTRYMPHTIVFSVVPAAFIAVLAFGSVRTAASFLFVAVVAGAGVLLGRSALIAAVGISSALLGGLTLAERHGWMHTPNFGVGLTVWLTHTATLLVVAILVFYSRSRAEAAFQRQLQELSLRKRTEQERDRSLDRFARIFRSSPSPMLAQSVRNGMILDANPAFERCFGYTRDQVLGQSDQRLWADPAQRISYVEQLTEHRRTDRVAVRSQRADGSHFDSLVSSEMSDDPGDRLVITTIIDVNSQNEAMERLRKSEERFAKAFNFSPLKMTITRLSDGQFVEVNQARDPVQGLSRADLLGKTTLEMGGWLSAEERQAFIQRLLADGHVSGYETRMRHTDGGVIDAKMWAERIEIDGEDCVLSCFINTTEEKRREAQLLALTRGMAGPSGDALFQALTLHMAQAIEADMVTVSELRGDHRARTLAVWKDGGSSRNYSFDLGGTPCAEALNRPDLCVYESELTQHFPGYRGLADEGLQAYVGQALRDEDGTPIGVLNAFWRHPVQLSNDSRALIAIFASRANAELVRLRRDREILRLNSSLEERVRERTAELGKLNAELDSFAYSVSHDLKSPLRAIDGFTQLLQESLQERLDAHEAELFGRVLAGTHRMSTLIADLLALARVSQGPLQRSRVDLSALAQQVLQAEQAKHPGRVLRWQVAPGLHAQCDARLARIALENLLGNAVKYTRDQAEAVIEFGQLPGGPGAPGDFFVRDNGTGFDMAHADKLFQPFQRLHMPSAGFEGTGIGLATVRRILERHGGSIRAFARPGEGAHFQFSFEAAAHPARPQTTPAP